jgi:hypothetical protein
LGPIFISNFLGAADMVNRMSVGWWIFVLLLTIGVSVGLVAARDNGEVIIIVEEAPCPPGTGGIDCSPNWSDPPQPATPGGDGNDLPGGGGGVGGEPKPPGESSACLACKYKSLQCKSAARAWKDFCVTWMTEYAEEECAAGSGTDGTTVDPVSWEDGCRPVCRREVGYKPTYFCHRECQRWYSDGGACLGDWMEGGSEFSAAAFTIGAGPGGPYGELGVTFSARDGLQKGCDLEKQARIAECAQEEFECREEHLCRAQ